MTSIRTLALGAVSVLALSAGAAQAEGEVNIYSYRQPELIQPLMDAFTKETGIKTNVLFLDKGLVERITAEGANSPADVILTIDIARLTEAKDGGVTQPLNDDDINKQIPAQYRDTDGNWFGLTTRGRVVYASKDRVSEDAITYEELADPKWKGKLGYEVQDIEWFITVCKLLGDDKGVQFFKDLVKKNGLSVRKGHTLLDNLVAAGEVPLALTLYNYMPAQAKAQGAPIDWFVIEPAVARANGMGVVKGAEHPNAAALFEDYMLGEAQPVLASLEYVPVSSKVASPFKGVKLRVFDPAEVLDHADKWRPLYDRIIVKGDGN